jgi:hypothetical protein
MKLERNLSESAARKIGMTAQRRNEHGRSAPRFYFTFNAHSDAAIKNNVQLMKMMQMRRTDKFPRRNYGKINTIELRYQLACIRHRQTPNSQQKYFYNDVLSGKFPEQQKEHKD